MLIGIVELHRELELGGGKATDLQGKVEFREREIVLDFNYAYNPSCVYSPLWACPLAPPENTLEVPVRAGERMYVHPGA